MSKQKMIWWCDNLFNRRWTGSTSAFLPTWTSLTVGKNANVETVQRRLNKLFNLFENCLLSCIGMMNQRVWSRVLCVSFFFIFNKMTYRAWDHTLWFRSSSSACWNMKIYSFNTMVTMSYVQRLWRLISVHLCLPTVMVTSHINEHFMAT
jgi:hypothetical protein